MLPTTLGLLAALALAAVTHGGWRLGRRAESQPCEVRR